MAAPEGWQELVGFVDRPGLAAAIEAAGHRILFNNSIWICSNAAAAQAVISSYSGSAPELAYLKGQKQAALDLLFDLNFDLAKFIRGGNATSVSANNVGTFLAQITNNYRSLRASIAAAATAAAVNAININSGWPANP